MREIPVKCKYDDNGWAYEIEFADTVTVKNGETIRIERNPFCTKVFVEIPKETVGVKPDHPTLYIFDEASEVTKVMLEIEDVD